MYLPSEVWPDHSIAVYSPWPIEKTRDQPFPVLSIGDQVLLCSVDVVDDHAQRPQLSQSPEEGIRCHGGVYCGQWQDGQRHGRGIQYYDDGTVYDCEWDRDVPHGHAKLTFPSGVVFEGAFVHGEVCGYGKKIYPNGGVYEGCWKDSVRHGKGVMQYENGTVYEGQWKNDLMEGFGKLTISPSGTIYEGEFKADRMHGQGTLRYADGTVCEGEWKADQMHGQGTMRYASGMVYIGEWQDNRPHGQGRLTYSDGGVGEGHFVNGQLHHGYYRGHGGYRGEIVDGWRHGPGTFTLPSGEALVMEWRRGAFLVDPQMPDSLRAKRLLILNEEEAVDSVSRVTYQWIQEDWKEFTAQLNRSSIPTAYPWLDRLIRAGSVGLLPHFELEDLNEQQMAQIGTLSRQHPVLLFGGADRHAMAYVLYREDLYLCQRAGNRRFPDKRPIARRARIHDGQNETVIGWLQGMMSEAEGLERVYTGTELPGGSTLYAEGPAVCPLFDRPQRTQRAANCSFFSPLAGTQVGWTLGIREWLESGWATLTSEEQAALRAADRSEEPLDLDRMASKVGVDLYKAFRQFQKTKYGKTVFDADVQVVIPGNPTVVTPSA
ncbi:MAG: MORN repeat-containing protein [Chlamydiia bacterium]